MLSAVLVSIVGYALVSTNVTSMKALKAARMRGDLQDIKQTISNRLSCKNSLATFGPPPITCNTAVTLKDKENSNLVPVSGKLGEWNITARCEVLDGQNGLSIYATKKRADGSFDIDPLNKSVVFNETSPVSQLFKPSVRPCQSFFTTSVGTSCSIGEAMTGLEPDGTPICSRLFGGNYQTRVCDTMGVMHLIGPGGGCRRINPLTGSCGCPPGFTPYLTDDFNSGSCPQEQFEARGMLGYTCL